MDAIVLAAVFVFPTSLQKCINSNNRVIQDRHQPFTLLMQVMHLLSKQGKSKMQRRLHKVRLQRQKMSKISLRMQRASLQSMHLQVSKTLRRERELFWRATEASWMRTRVLQRNPGRDE